MHQKNIIRAGSELLPGSNVLIMLHGRGGSAQDILSLAAHLNVSNFTLLAPQATNNTWYPYSFLAPVLQNEPWLSSALSILKNLVNELLTGGVAAKNIYFAGFSQGACLTLEFVTRNATSFGGVAAFTGGLIGEEVEQQQYSGDFGGTPIFIGSSNPDLHIPVERVHATAQILKEMNAAVTVKLYTNMGHTINQDEIETVNKLVFTSNS